MSRRCELTAKGPLVGHKVSHSNIKTKRRFLPNLCNVTFISEALGRNVRLRVSTNALKSVDHNGGLDAFLIKAQRRDLSPRALDLKRQIEKKQGRRAGRQGELTSRRADATDRARGESRGPIRDLEFEAAGSMIRPFCFCEHQRGRRALPDQIVKTRCGSIGTQYPQREGTRKCLTHPVAVPQRPGLKIIRLFPDR